MKLISLQRIWDAAPHNAFTDLVRFDNRWFCTFREGAAHVSPDGAIRILTSDDGATWRSAALIATESGDLRDPKLYVTPDASLMLNAVLYPKTAKVLYESQSLAWFSRDGHNWSESIAIGEPNVWLWRVTWHDDVAYSVGYHTIREAEKWTRLYASRDGKYFQPLVADFFHDYFPNEATLRFADTTCFCLLRCEEAAESGHVAQLGRTEPPYTDWTWQTIDTRIGGPNFIFLPNGEALAAVRLYDEPIRTALCRLDLDKSTLSEVLTLPSGGDTSYAGMVWHESQLWLSYYSSHEGKSSIYLAQVQL